MTDTYDAHNIFAKILRGEVPCKKIYENNDALAFYDAFPKAPIHALVIPKGSYVNMSDFLNAASPESILGFWANVHETIRILNVRDAGFRLISNCGAHGGQEVPHMHIHILGGKEIGPMVSLRDV